MYGTDLRDVLWGPEPTGARRLLSLMRWLPKDGAVAQATDSSWTQQDELLATIVEIIAATNQAEIRYPRPWDEQGEKHDQPRAQSSLDEVRALTGTMASGGDAGSVVMG